MYDDQRVWLIWHLILFTEIELVCAFILKKDIYKKKTKKHVFLPVLKYFQLKQKVLAGHIN